MPLSAAPAPRIRTHTNKHYTRSGNHHLLLLGRLHGLPVAHMTSPLHLTLRLTPCSLCSLEDARMFTPYSPIHPVVQSPQPTRATHRAQVHALFTPENKLATLPTMAAPSYKYRHVPRPLTLLGSRCHSFSPLLSISVCTLLCWLPAGWSTLILPAGNILPATWTPLIITLLR